MSEGQDNKKPTQAWLDWLKAMELPSKRDGESAENWTDRVARSGRAIGRFRQCSIGWHDECSDRQGMECECPCHDMDKHQLAIACRELEEELRTSRTQQWRKFDKDDSSTWPLEGSAQPFVIWVDGDGWQRDLWTRFGDDFGHWYDYLPEYVTHWMEITVPEAPT